MEKPVSVNPATGVRFKTYEFLPRDHAMRRVERSWSAFRDWRRTTLEERADLLRALSHGLNSKKGSLAELMSREMGKPLAQSAAEIEKCSWGCDYYASHGPSFLAAQMTEAGARKSFVSFQPLGPVLAIMPWNFPFWQVLRFAAPALMAGNTALLKHAPNVLGCALAIEALFREAGYPEGVFQTLVTDLEVTSRVIAHPHVAAVTLTGSTRAGKAVAAQAGGLMKKCVFELGGSDPYLILEDAHIEAAAETCVVSRLINTGQSCIAAKRFLVVEKLRKPFEEACLSIMKNKTMGNALEGSFDLGPLAREDLRENLHRQVRESVVQGARCLLGGAVPEGPGYFYPPTLLADVRPGMPAFDEETFGPAAAIVPVADEREAIELANSTEYGLGAAVFTRDLERGEHIARYELEAGSCFVNEFVKSDPRLPFGGIKQSGFGRELSVFGIREFVNIKTVFVR